MCNISIHICSHGLNTSIQLLAFCVKRNDVFIVLRSALAFIIYVSALITSDSNIYAAKPVYINFFKFSYIIKVFHKLKTKQHLQEKL